VPSRNVGAAERSPGPTREEEEVFDREVFDRRRRPAAGRSVPAKEKAFPGLIFVSLVSKPPAEKISTRRNAGRKRTVLLVTDSRLFWN